MVPEVGDPSVCLLLVGLSSHEDNKLKQKGHQGDCPGRYCRRSSVLCWTSCWTNSRNAGDLRHLAAGGDGGGLPNQPTSYRTRRPDLTSYTVADFYLINTLRPRRNGRHFPDDIFKWIFLNENVWVLIKISLGFIPRCPIKNIPALVQIMAWGRPGDIYASLGLIELILSSSWI